MSAGIERMQVDFGLEKSRGHRFARWALMYMLGNPLDLSVAFTDESDRNSARDFMDLMDQTAQS